MRKLFAVLLIVGLLACVFLFLIERNMVLSPTITMTTAAANQVNYEANFRSEKPKLVLIYTDFFYGGVPWKGLKDSNDFTRFKGEKCPINNCILTYNKTRDFWRSNIVIFHAYNIPRKVELLRLKKNRPNGQVWVYFNLENPIVISYIAPLKRRRDLDGVFNWTMTFMRSSDIFFPYGFFVPLKPVKNADRPLKKHNYAKGKDRLAVWTASGCGQVVPERKVRLQYVQHLREHLKVDVYGKCAEYLNQNSLKDASCSRQLSTDGLPTPTCKTLLQRYKFFLAFENMDCSDYITEKYWCTPLELDILPIVMGGADYKALAIPGSYIDVGDFSSQKELADYLMYLDKNDTAYNEYFEWKQYYRVGGCFRRQNMVVNYPWMCKLCEAAHNNTLPSKVYSNMHDFWNPEKNCKIHYSRLKEALLVN